MGGQLAPAVQNQSGLTAAGPRDAARLAAASGATHARTHYCGSPKRVTSSHRDIETEGRGAHPETSEPAKGEAVKGYIVVFEGDEQTGYSAYSPDLLGVVAVGESRGETERLMLEAIAQHLALLRKAGQPVPEPAEADSVTLLDPAAA